MAAVRVKAEKRADQLDQSGPARPPEMLAAAPGADRLAPLRLGLRWGRRPPVRWGRFGNHRRLELRRCRRRSLDQELLVTRLRAHLARCFAEKETGARGPFRFAANHQCDLKGSVEIAGMDLQVALGEKDPAAEVRVIDRK